MVTVWWSLHGVIHYSFLRSGYKIFENSWWLLSRYSNNVGERETHPWYHETSHCSTTRFNITSPAIINHTLSTYSLDLAPTYHHFSDAIHNVLIDFFESRSPELYHLYCKGISDLLSRWQKCIDNEGKYFDLCHIFLLRKIKELHIQFKTAISYLNP